MAPAILIAFILQSPASTSVLLLVTTYVQHGFISKQRTYVHSYNLAAAFQPGNTAAAASLLPPPSRAMRLLTAIPAAACRHRYHVVVCLAHLLLQPPSS